MYNKNERIKEAIEKNTLNKDFSNVQQVCSGGLGNVYRAKWIDNTVAKKIACEVVIIILYFFNTYSLYLF